MVEVQILHPAMSQMNMSTITNIEIKQTKTGKDYKQCKLDTQVLGKDQFNVFAFHSMYAEVEQGVDFGEDKFILEGQYLNLKDPKKTMSRGGAFKSHQIKEAQDTKRQDINQAQQNREKGIKTASTMRMAVDLAIAECGEDKSKLAGLIKHWREFCWTNWEADEASYIPF